MRALRFRIILAAFVVLAIVGVLLPGGSGGVRPHLPRLGHVPSKPKALERQVKAAQEKAVDQCPLAPGEAKERKVVNGAPGVQKAVDHDAGDCAPGPSNKASVIPHGGLIGDWSNNDPIYGTAWKAVHAHGIRGAWLKTSEGATFRDRTLVTMAHDARSAGLTVGGYHFAHVCMTSPVAEGQLMVSQLNAAHLLGSDPPALRPVLDVEYGGCSSGAGGNAWIASLYSYVKNATHQRVGVYSGNWWLAPHTSCLFAHLPKDTLSWISGYPNAVAPCGHALDVHQFSDSYLNGANRSDMSRLVAASGEDVLAGGAKQAPPEATHQCRMHSHYVAWFRQYTARQLERHKRKPPKELDAIGAARLKSATDHLYVIRHYFTKNHEHGRANYDCHRDGTVTVREVKAAPKPKPPKPKPAHTSVSAPFRIVGGRAPAPSLIAPYIDIVTDGATVNSVYRGEDAASILHSCGLHTQGEVFASSPPGVANPPGFSTHELRSDGVAYPVPRGEKLDAWQVGIDVNDSDVADVIAHARRLGWTMFQPYPGSAVEFHHVGYLSRPGPNEHVSKDKIRARRERLPTHC